MRNYGIVLLLGGLVGSYVGLPALAVDQANLTTPATFRLVLGKKKVVDQNDIQSINARENAELGSWEILIELNPKGAEKLSKVTGANIGKALKIMVDGKEISAPVIRAKIGGGHVAFAQHYSQAEAEALVGRIQAALPQSKNP